MLSQPTWTFIHVTFTFRPLLQSSSSSVLTLRDRVLFLPRDHRYIACNVCTLLLRLQPRINCRPLHHDVSRHLPPAMSKDRLTLLCIFEGCCIWEPGQHLRKKAVTVTTHEPLSCIQTSATSCARITCFLCYHSSKGRKFASSGTARVDECRCRRE